MVRFRPCARKGDYWGGRSLMEERNNVATIRPAGKDRAFSKRSAGVFVLIFVHIWHAQIDNVK